MPLVFACIAPHGGECLPEFATSAPERAARTRAALAELGRRLEAQQPDTVVVATPHGVAAGGALCIPFAGQAAGDLTEGEVRVAASFAVDVDLALALARRSAEALVPVIAVAAGETTPLDWGALIPLYYMGHRYARRPKVVTCTPSPDLSYDELEAAGIALAEAAGADGRRVAFIASADQGHAHHKDGPYGFDEMSAVYDRHFVEAVAAEDLGRLKALDAALLERGKPDSLWQALMLHGALQRCPMRGELLSYEVPTYFGMLCAAYTPR